MTAVTEAPADTKPADEGTDDIDAFENAVLEADINQVTDPKSASVRSVRQAYTDLSRKGKAAAKKWLDKQAEEALDNDDTESTRRFVLLAKNGTRVISANVGRPAVPDSEKKKQNILQLQIGYALAAAAANNDPELAGWDQEVTATQEDITAAGNYAAWIEGGMEGDEPEATPAQKAGARVSLGRGPNGQGRKPKAADAE